MTATRTREWLRGFLRLDAEASREKIAEAEIRRQEDTVLRALEVLDREPGVVLADEVGMGKTFEALGLVAAFRQTRPQGRVLVLTPGPDLNGQWFSNMRRFHENGFHAFRQEDYGEVYSLQAFPEAVQTWPIVFAPINIFMGGRAEEEHRFLLAAFFRWARLHEESRKQIAAHVFGSRRDVPDVSQHLFLGRYSYDDLRGLGEDVFDEAFRQEPSEEDRDDIPASAVGLSNLYEGRTDAFKHWDSVARALGRARFRLLKRLLPEFDLLIVDEAHKLKNPWAVRSQAVSNTLFRKYAKTVFLTATPFQLSIQELKQVFNIFSWAKDAPPLLAKEVEQLFADIGTYQEVYDRFESDWARSDGALALAFGELYSRNPALDERIEDALLRRIAESARELLRLKRERIEPAFRRWMIRSVKLEKFEYRRAIKKEIRPEGEARIPFLIYERILAEVFRRGETTYKAAVEINLASSFDAALKGSLLDENRKTDPAIDEYRKLLRGVLEADKPLADNHPKLADVVDNSYIAAMKGEKTLIFSERNETIRALRRALASRWEEDLLLLWRRVEPDITEQELWGAESHEKGRHARMQQRFRQPTDSLYLALRENYLHTIVEIPDEVLSRRAEILERANQVLAAVRTKPYPAERLDYRIVNRCVGQAVLQVAGDSATPLEGEGTRKSYQNLLDPHYVALGLDLEYDDEEGDAPGDEPVRWTISERILEHIVPKARRGIWWSVRERLSSIEPHTRVRLVEAVASFFTRREVSFMPELLAKAKEAGRTTSSEDLREVLDSWWEERGNPWRRRLEEFVDYFNRLNDSARKTVLDEALKTGEFVRDTLDGDAREKLKEAFNTPFYPMVLVGNQVMQEGLDLHRNCRRVVHYDLSWNPAQLEQRVGRVDRIGSLVRRKRELDGTTTLDMHFPLVERTIDIHQYRVVREREKWLDILLGAPPDFREHDPSAPRPPPLPEQLVRDLTVQLRP